MPDITKRTVAVRLPLEVAALVERKYAVEGDRSICDAYIRALEAAAGDCPLTKADYKEIDDEMQANLKRNQRRKVEYAKKHGTRTYTVI